MSSLHQTFQILSLSDSSSPSSPSRAHDKPLPALPSHSSRPPCPNIYDSSGGHVNFPVASTSHQSSEPTRIAARAPPPPPPPPPPPYSMYHQPARYKPEEPIRPFDNVHSGGAADLVLRRRNPGVPGVGRMDRHESEGWAGHRVYGDEPRMDSAVRVTTTGTPHESTNSRPSYDLHGRYSSNSPSRYTYLYQADHSSYPNSPSRNHHIRYQPQMPPPLPTPPVQMLPAYPTSPNRITTTETYRPMLNSQGYGSTGASNPPQHHVMSAHPTPPRHVPPLVQSSLTAPTTPPRPSAQDDTVSARIHSPSTSSPKSRVRVTPSTKPPGSPADSSFTDSPSARSKDKVQCSGFTQKGIRCRKMGGSSGNRRVEIGAADDETEGWLCWIHKEVILAEEGFYVDGKGRSWIEFDDWIPSGLSEDVGLAIRLEMERPITVADQTPGFVYCFEYRGLQTESHRTFKIGRSLNPVARMEEWGRQCPSHRAVLLGYRPTPVGSEEAECTGGGRMRGMRRLGGADGEGQGVKGSAKFERLVHLEVGDMYRGIKTRQECVDCKKFHQELFLIPREADGQEWLRQVEPVMDRWERFVRELVR